MERGPMALFGAIIAVGLGPAMWLGAQFGEVTLSPGRPPAVTSVQNVEAPKGGSGAGDAPTDTEAIRTEPKSNNQPLTSPRDVRPVTTVTTSPVPVKSTEPAGPAEPPATTTPPADSGPVEVTDPPPTESTTAPADPPPATADPDDPPVTPAEPETGQPASGTAQT